MQRTLKRASRWVAQFPRFSTTSFSPSSSPSSSSSSSPYLGSWKAISFWFARYKPMSFVHTVELKAHLPRVVRCAKKQFRLAMPRRRTASLSLRRRRAPSRSGRSPRRSSTASRREPPSRRVDAPRAIRGSVVRETSVPAVGSRASGSRRGGGYTAEAAASQQLLQLVASHGGQRTEELAALRAVIQARSSRRQCATPRRALQGRDTGFPQQSG